MAYIQILYTLVCVIRLLLILLIVVVLVHIIVFIWNLHWIDLRFVTQNCTNGKNIQGMKERNGKFIHIYLYSVFFFFLYFFVFIIFFNMARSIVCIEILQNKNKSFWNKNTKNYIYYMQFISFWYKHFKMQKEKKKQEKKRNNRTKEQENETKKKKKTNSIKI